MDDPSHIRCINDSSNALDRHNGDLGIYNKFTMKLPVEQITVPLLLIVGFPGTIISFIIWTRKQMRYSSSVYLSILAVADGLFLMYHIIWHLNSAYDIRVINNPLMCNLFPTFNYFLQYLSPTLTLAFTVERYISICWPFSREKLCSISRAIKVSIYLVVANLTIASPTLYFFRYVSEDNKGCLAIYEVYNYTIPVKQTTHWIAMFTYNLVTELLMFACIPFIILIINIRVIIEMWRIYKSTNHGSIRSENHHRGATTVTLLCVSFYLISASLPQTIVHLYGFIITQGNLCLSDEEIVIDSTWRKVFFLANVNVFVEFFTISYCGAKFYIYMGTSQAFRKAFSQMFKIFNKDFAESRNSRCERKFKNDQTGNKYKIKIPDNESMNLLSTR